MDVSMRSVDLDLTQDNALQGLRHLNILNSHFAAWSGTTSL